MVEIRREVLLSSNNGRALKSGRFVPGGEGQDPQCPPKGWDGPPSRGQENLVGMIQVLCYTWAWFSNVFMYALMGLRDLLSVSAVGFACPFKISWKLWYFKESEIEFVWFLSLALSNNLENGLQQSFLGLLFLFCILKFYLSVGWDQTLCI